MSNTTSAKRENLDIRMTERKRLKRILCAPQGCSMRRRSERLSFHSLPEDIVSRIMSELTLKEAARTSVVSSKWRRYWRLHPSLSFDISSVLGSKAKRRNQSSDRYKRMLAIKRFIDTVNQILKKHSGIAVNKLAVKFELRKEHANHIDGWASFAIASKAKIVTLNFSPYRGLYEDNYSFPCHLFNTKNASYLQALRLDSVNLGPSPDFCGFANLKMLALDYVLALQDLQYFLSKCPVLEWLSIRWCYYQNILHASEPLCRLKYLCVQDSGFIKIDFVVPNLNTFEYRGSQTLIKLDECSKLRMAVIDLQVQDTLEYVFTEIPNVLPHVETLRVEAIVRAEIPGFKQSPIVFSHLRHLALKIRVNHKTAVLQLACLLGAAPVLEGLHLDMLCYEDSAYPSEGDMIADCHHYSLKTACLTGFYGGGGQVELVKYIMRNAVELESMIVDPRNRLFNSPVMFDDDGRLSAKWKLVPLDTAGVLTVL